MMDKFIMVGDEAVACPDLMEWGKWFESSERHVGNDERGNVHISTVFLGIDHGFNWNEERENYKPVLWETMIFGGPMDQEQWRYDSLEKAKAGHKAAVRLAELTNIWWYYWWAFYIRPFWANHIRPYVRMI